MTSRGRGGWRGTRTKRIMRHIDPLWQHVTKTTDRKGFTCVYCQQVVRGGLPKIRDHFLRFINCSEVPDDVRDTIKGLPSPKKRLITLGSQAPSGEAIVPHLLFNFILSTNLAYKEIANSPLHQLLSSIAENGPSSLKFVENATDFQNSRRAFEDYVKERMEQVMNTWKTSGCTLIFYSFNERLVPALYSPAGLIFLDVKIERKNPSFYSYLEIKKALENHSPPVSLDEDVIAILYHDKREFTDCRHQVSNLHNPSDQDLDDTDLELMDLDFFAVVDSDLAIDASLKYSCIRVLVNDFCRELIQKNDLVRDVVRNSGKLHKFLTLPEKSDFGIYHGLKRDYTGPMPPINRISELSSEIKSWLSNLSTDGRDALAGHLDTIALIEDNMFWFNMRILIKCLQPLLRIPDELDTFSPSIGYVRVFLSKAESSIHTFVSMTPDSGLQSVIECFRNWKRNNKDLNSPLQLLANFLSPVSILNVLDWEAEVKLESDALLIELCSEYQDFSEQAVQEEVSRYCSIASNPFVAISGRHDHPVMLWRKHGKLFPLLKMAAEKVLSLPMCCMCNQIQIQSSRLQGYEDADDYILRLNVLMLREFEKMKNEYPCINLM